MQIVLTGYGRLTRRRRLVITKQTAKILNEHYRLYLKEESPYSQRLVGVLDV